MDGWMEGRFLLFLEGSVIVCIWQRRSLAGGGMTGGLGGFERADWRLGLGNGRLERARGGKRGRRDALVWDEVLH